MNLKIDQILPYPHSFNYFTLTHATTINAILMYGHNQIVQEKPEEPKKKFTFKAKQPTASATEVIYVYDLTKKEWRNYETKGKMPSKRSNMCAVFIDPCLIIYGGTNLAPPFKNNNDVCALNINTWTWKKLFSIESPSPYHLNTLIKFNPYSFALASKDLWTFSVKDVKWELNANELPGGVWQKIFSDFLIQPIGGFAFNENQIVLFENKQNQLAACRVNLESKKSDELVLVKKIQADKNFHVFYSQKKVIYFNCNKIGQFDFDENRVSQINQKVLECNELNGIVEQESERQLNLSYFGVSIKHQLINISCEFPEEQKVETTRPINSKTILRNNSSIAEESNEESVFYSKEGNNSEIKPHRHSFESEKEQSQLDNSEVLIEVEDQLLKSENHQEYDTGVLKATLKEIFGNSMLKRRVLEEKSKLLENSIKKAEKMVLQLCKFSNQREKKRHIESVKEMRQQLETILNLQLYYRREIEGVDNKINLNKIVRECLPSDCHQFFT